PGAPGRRVGLAPVTRKEASMEQVQRREFLLGTGTAAGVFLLDRFGSVAFAQQAGQLIPWSDQPPPVPPPAQAVIKNLSSWESPDTWLTPNDKFFGIGHYEWPKIDTAKWKLDVI